MPLAKDTYSQLPVQPDLLHERKFDYSYAVNTHDPDWDEVLSQFHDASMFQTLAFCSVQSPRSKIERFVLRRDSVIVAATLVRVTSIPGLGEVCGYVRWGPMWHRRNEPADPEILRQAVRSLRQEYVVKKKMWLRLLPDLQSDDNRYIEILREEGFVSVEGGRRARTMWIDLSPPLDTLRKGLDQKWRNQLNGAEKNGLEIVSGCDDERFDQFLVPYKEMLLRKNISESGDIRAFQEIHKALPNKYKMRVFLCLLQGEVCAGAIVSLIGDHALYLFGGTGDVGAKNRGSYLIQWRIIEWLKQENCTVYDLHGVNRDSNPGVYHFKAGLTGKNGKEVEYSGKFDSTDGIRSRLAARIADIITVQSANLRSVYRTWRLRRA